MATKLAVVVAALLLLAGSSSSAAGPWNRRCPAMPAEQRFPAPPRTAALRFFSWIRPAARGLRSGPVYVVALSSRTAISRDGDERDGAASYRHRALVAIDPSYSGAVTLTGRRLGRPGRRTVLGFSMNGATRCTVAAQHGWRIVRTELRIGRTGCFRVGADGPGLYAGIPLVPGPDYGTAGW